MNLFEFSTRRLVLVFVCTAPMTTPVDAQEAVQEQRTSESQPSQTEADKQARLAPIAIEFVEQMANGEFDAAIARFDETMSKALPAEQLKSVWSNVTRAVGGFEKSTRTFYESADVYDILFVTCKFERASLDVKVVFDQARQITGLFFVPVTHRSEYVPPPYVNSTSFRDVEVTFGNDPWFISGTLSLPLDASNLPAVILVHGSGPNDRNETVGANQPFRDLAGGLASKGIAVLRYDKRTKTYGAKLSKEITVREETIEDVIAAADLLASRSEIDPGRIVVLGHSLGGYLVPRIARADSSDRIAGFVIMAGNTRPLEDLVLEQTRYFLGLDGEVSETDRQSLDAIEQQVDQIKNINQDSAPATVLGASATYWRDLSGYQPHQEAKQVAKPMLILQGERDYQVTLEDFANWKSSLADRTDVRFRSYPELNHLMIAGSGPSKPAEYNVAGHVSEAVINDIAAWIDGLKQSAK